MKTVKMFAMAAMLMVSAASFAQGWSSLSVSYNPVSLEPKHGDDLSLTGFSATYSKAFPVTQSLPLYVEVGVGLQYAFGTDDSDKTTDDLGSITYEQKYSMLSAKIPVNIMYVIDIPNTKVKVAPFAGITANLNILATQKADLELSGMYADYRDMLEGALPNGWDDSRNMFDKDDMGDNDNCMKRLVLGAQVGANVYYNDKYYIGASYGFGLTDAMKDVKQSVCAITLGMNF